MYKYNIREEIFGATIYDLTAGKRFYISNDELNNLYSEYKLPDDFENIFIDKKELKIIKKDNIDSINCFSFADIAYVELTRKCNLRCKHCLNSSGNELENQLTYEELENMILKFSKSGIQEIRFTGGEPLVFEKIYDLIKLCTDNGIYTSIGTNGILISKTVALKLKKAGLKKAIVSIDGTQRKHDYIRGEGNYKKAMNGIDNLLEQGIDVRVNSVIMKENIDDVIEFARNMHSKKQSLFIRRFIESGRGTNFTNNMLTKEDYDYVREQLQNELDSGKYVNGHYLRNKDDVVNSRIYIPFKIKEGCKAGERALVITPEGNIHLCGFLAAQGFPEVGNIRNISDWNQFWFDIHSKKLLANLENKLQEFNEKSGIQKTNCLAYVQRSIMREGENK